MDERSAVKIKCCVVISFHERVGAIHGFCETWYVNNACKQLLQSSVLMVNIGETTAVEIKRFMRNFHWSTAAVNKFSVIC